MKLNHFAINDRVVVPKESLVYIPDVPRANKGTIVEIKRGERYARTPYIFNPDSGDYPAFPANPHDIELRV